MSFQMDLIDEEPGHAPSPGFDASAWRLAYFGRVGTVCRYRDTNKLALCYAARVDDYAELRAELLAAPGNVSAVLTACDEAKAAVESAFCPRQREAVPA